MFLISRDKRISNYRRARGRFDGKRGGRLLDRKYRRLKFEDALTSDLLDKRSKALLRGT